MKNCRKPLNQQSEDFDFGGWQSDEEKLRYNLTWTPEQILTWLEEANAFTVILKEEKHVLRTDH